MQVLATVRKRLELAFDALDERCRWPAEVRAQRSPGGWSIDEILEHVALTDHFVLLLIEKGARKALARGSAGAAPADPARYVERFHVIDRVGEPAFAWTRPDHMQPTGGVPWEEVRDKLRAQRAQALDTLDSLGQGQGSLHTTRLAVGPIEVADVYEFIYFLAVHAARHAAQIDRVRANDRA